MKEKIALIILTLFCLVLYFYKLGQFPSVFNRDEAAIGYNAYAISQYGRDEFGQYFPLTFKSFGDYKMPLYIYVTSLAIKLFGVNEFSVRFFSAFAGLSSILLLYFIVKQISKSRKIAFLSSLFLSSAPFYIHYSRLAFEANFGLFLVLLAIYLFILGTKKGLFFLLAGLIFVLSMFCYFTPLLLTLPIVFFLSIFFPKNTSRSKNELPSSKPDGTPVLHRGSSLSYLLHPWSKLHGFHRSDNKLLYFSFLIIVVLGFFISLKTTLLANQAKSNITVFKDQKIWEEMAKSRQDHQENNKVILKLFDNQYIFYGKHILINYLSSFDGEFLFFKGGIHPWHNIPQAGPLYLLTLPLFIFGILAIFSKNKIKDYFFICLLLLAPFPSAITTDAPHITRLLLFFVVFLVISAYGADFLIIKAKKPVLTVGILILIYSYSFLFFLQSYLIHFPRNYSPLWMPNIKKAVEKAGVLKEKYNKLIVNDDGSSYIYFLFYEKTDLDKYLKTVKYTQDNQGFVHILSYNGYDFFRVNLKDVLNKNIINIY